MTLGYYCENADGALAIECPKTVLCVIVFIRPQTGVYRGTGHSLCGASQSWLNCWMKSSFGTEGWDIPSGPLLGCQWPYSVGTGRALSWLVYMIALVNLFFGSVENMAHVHGVIWGFNLESSTAMSWFSGIWNGLFSYSFFYIWGDCTRPFTWSKVVHLITTWLHFCYISLPNLHSNYS